MKIARVFGIDIRIHPSFWVLPVGLSLWYAKDYGWEVGLRLFVLVLLVFLCVVGHELSHSVQALRLGIPVPTITLYAMGGVARMERIPRKPGQEFVVSIAGPLFNFILAALLYFPLYYTLGPQALFHPSLESWPQMLANVFWVNPVLGAFNLIPAFPMDGGRILRAALSTRIAYLQATRISVFIGRFFAILFFLLGVWNRHWMLVLVGIYVFRAASDEWRQAVSRDTHEPA